MKSFQRLRLALALTLALLAAGPAPAAITVLDYWRMGENDANAVSGGLCTNTVDAVAGHTLTNTSVGGVYPIYTNGVSVAASADTGSTLALSLTNGQYGTATVATNLTDNFGIECWVKPGTTAPGGQVLAYNGLRGNGWGLYQSGTNFEVLYGGFVNWGSSLATAGVWTHLALVRNNGVATLYTNGVPASTYPNTPITPSGGFTVGGDAQYGEYFTGTIDEVRVFTFAPGAFSTNDLLLNSTNLFVSNTSDNGAGSLRAAVANAPNGSTITFATNLSGQTITLTSGQIELGNNVTIDASALANGIAINGNGQSRIFYVDGGVTAVLNDLVITNGSDYIGGDQGGGVVNYGSLTMNRCTVAGNQANSSDGGGGICNETGTLTVNNCTFTGNQANNSFFGGGGICAGGDGDGGIVNVNNCTFTGNQAEYGGAISLAGGTVNINNSTISGNQSGGGGGVDIYAGLLNLTNSIACANSPNNIDAPINSGTHNLVDANALLAPLGNYGGPTQTMPPLAGSPAIAAGLDSVTNFLATDQRGHSRLSGAHVDIGAVEVNTNTIVTTSSDDSNPGSLRNVIANTTNTDLISFAQNLSGQTILLTNGEIELANSVTIDGLALANGIVVNGNNQSRIFLVDSGATVGLNSLAIVNGNDNGGNGAGINNQGTLTINNSTLADNIATGYGGGIENGGVLTLNQTTVTGNSSPADAGGGGIDASPETTTVINQSTITGNTESGNGSGGVLSYGGTLTVNNSIIAGNRGGDIGYGYSNSLTLLGTNLTSGNPLLAPLGNYGGPTPTMPPMAGSPAINAGDDAVVVGPATDQRGQPRVSGTHVDIGAVEFQVGTVVSNNTDAGENSLRADVAYNPPDSIITFDPNLSGLTITLTNGQIELSNNVTIDGSALANGIQISGNHSSRVFNIGTSGATLISLTLTNANGGGGDGGALLNAGNTVLNYCTFTGNSTGSGGAIKNAGGSLILNECTLYGNSTMGGGGGGIVNYADLFLNGCTLTGNSAGFFGGAVYSETGAHVSLNNTIAAGNTANDIYNNGTLTLTLSNIVQSISGSQSGTTPINASPQLAPLGNYGGPTPTMPPLPGSPAIDAGDDSEAIFLQNDQRGYPRLAGAHVDIGAVEGIYNTTGPGTVTNVTRLGNGSIQFGFTNLVDANFPVLATTNISLPLSSWKRIGFATNNPAGSGNYQFTDPRATNYPQRFYRIRSP